MSKMGTNVVIIMTIADHELVPMVRGLTRLSRRAMVDSYIFQIVLDLCICFNPFMPCIGFIVFVVLQLHVVRTV